MGGGSRGGGGSSTTTSQPSPEVARLQQTALPQIQRTLELNPLSQYAGPLPRTIAGTNPFYEAAFGMTPSLAASTPAMNFLWGNQPSVFPGMAMPSVGTGPFGPATTIPGLSPGLVASSPGVPQGLAPSVVSGNSALASGPSSDLASGPSRIPAPWAGILGFQPNPGQTVAVDPRTGTPIPDRSLGF